MRWPHPLRGEVRPAEFLPLAENTGLADALSRLALAQLGGDLTRLRADAGRDVAINFGALRHHLASDALARDAGEFVARAGDGLTLELRISERTLGTLANPERTLQRLHAIGARIVIDEFGRDFSSLALLARLPIAALQLDRSIVVASANDAASARICRATVGMARALGIATYAPGVDTESDHARLRDMQVDQGLGDFYRELSITREQVAASA
jgi:EAL domain-containing protein (putative c-di-GMP-specific phosphodiesterase class I)